jgi:DNA-binding GntR family transcriptional regulator
MRDGRAVNQTCWIAAVVLLGPSFVSFWLFASQFPSPVTAQLVLGELGDGGRGRPEQQVPRNVRSRPSLRHGGDGRRIWLMPPKADEIVHIVQSDIVSGRLPPGALLRQEHLARSFRVSRTPVREALKRLHSAGLVSLIPNRGARVRMLSLDDLRETFVVRAELEGLAAELAAAQINDEQRRRLRAAERQFARLSGELRGGSGEDDGRRFAAEWARANDEFHDIILEAAGVRLLTELAHGVRAPFVGQMLANWTDEVDALLAANVKQHRAIRELVEGGSTAGARAVMQEHIALSGALMELMVASTDPTSAGGKLRHRMSDPFYLRGGQAP